MVEQYDLAIIGSGPGGYVAAIRASQLGMKVIVIEKKDLGGICLNWGCIPTKALLRTSEIYDYIKNSEIYGLNLKNADYNLEKIIKRSRDVSKTLSSGIKFLFKKNNIKLLYGIAKIDKEKDIDVISDNETFKVKAKNIIIATGARPKKINLTDQNVHSKLWNYFDAMTPKTIPNSIGIIGSGAIGIEFASFYNSLGVKVNVFEMADNILPSEDHDVSVFLKQLLTKKGIAFNVNTSVSDINYVNNNFQLSCRDLVNGKDFFSNFDKVLVAIGISGNINDLGLENTNIKTKDDHIMTYNYGKTDEKNFFAIGDVTGAPWLAHKASHEGISCVEFIAGNKNDEPSKTVIPSCVFSNPQVASIGLTEKQANKKKIKVKIGKFPLSANGKALALSESEGFIKTIFEADTGQILGAHLIGAEVTELINTFSLAIKLEATELDIFSTIFPHPTVSEAIHESSLDAFDKAIHI